MLRRILVLTVLLLTHATYSVYTENQTQHIGAGGVDICQK